ncbi:MAG: NAD(P)/FAD-dependent oxidoreductase [Bacteroidota bacterium]|nr:NAD(P)/FAD-dependent oxidoreductase [Bacteroidota bacterium]
MGNNRLVIVGGGAAGFFCAVNAARMAPSLEVLIVEKSAKVLSKVRISGGGRCNLTHNCASIAEMAKNYPRGERFLKKAFSQFFTRDLMDWFGQRGVELKTESDGRVFPKSDSSQTIVDCLIQEANRYGVTLLLNREVVEIEQIDQKGAPGFLIAFSQGPSLESDYVCISPGGFPKSGQYHWLTRLGIESENPVPSLFTFNLPDRSLAPLMGISVPDVQVKLEPMGKALRGPMLLTHWGLSGPVILKLSSLGARVLADTGYHFWVTVNWVPEYHEQSLQEGFRRFRMEMAKKKMTNDNPFGLPRRLWEYHLQSCEIGEELRWADLPSRKANLLIRQLAGQRLEVKGKTTFKEEFVTAGGVKLSEVDPLTMASLKIPHLYFAGEILDVDGVTGGYNFQHAWTSGWIAARSICADFVEHRFDS